ncbi:MAG: TIGR04150 pseudo-rSAM protein [Bacteroidales bacterium]
MGDNYLYLYPDTFFFNGKDTMLLYSTANHNVLEIKSDSILQQLQNNLMQLENSYCIKIDDTILVQYKQVLDDIINGGFGSVVKTSFEKRPVSYPPVLKINRDIDSIRYDYGKGRAGYILQYLHEITIYLSGHKHIEDHNYKQTIYPIACSGKLVEEKLLKLIDSTQGGALDVINLLGDTKIISEYLNLFQMLRHLDIRVNFYILYEDFCNNKDTIEAIMPDFNIIVLYKGCFLKSINPSYDSVCLITSETEVNIAEQFLLENTDKEKSIELVPIYTGENLEFFKKNVFITKEEILLQKRSKQDIFINMELNTNYFGKLTILPDGHIYSNVNRNPLGTIDDSLYEIIYKELDESVAWRNVRNEEPCNKCRFRWLCPPVSNYEFIAKTYNLCTINIF